ncbi:MAG TPA: MFS transporter, partial [Solirubrobacterales bacterium]|nr:MFS transporter [Solirubrobacterales bacterium]
MSTLAAAPRHTASVLLRHRTAFWVATFALLTMLAYSAVPTPLYPLYQARDGFSSFMITVIFATYAVAIFATYAVGVVISLFTVGHLSDWHGRRRLVLPALGASMVSALVFIFWRDVPGLLVGRFISGLAVGAVTATATAWIAELHAQARPGGSPRYAEVVATAANLGGIGVGPLVSGALVAWVAHPLTVPFLVFLAALLVAAGLVVISPETREPVRPRPTWRPQRVSVPADARATYLAAAITAGISFASFGLFTSLAPSFLAGPLHNASPLLAGATAFIVFASGAAGQMFVSGRPIPVALAIGTGLMLTGLAIVVLA